MTNFKKLLLAGTAVVALGATSAPAMATDVTMGATPGTWSSAGTNNDDGTVAQAEAGANLNATVDATLNVTNDNTANDSGGVNAFTLGDVTDTSGTTLNIAVTSGQAADLTVTMDSVNIDGNFTVTGDAADDSTIAITFDDAAVASVIGGNLVLDNSAADAADTLTLTSQSALTVTGTTAVSAGSGAFANGAALVANKAATFTGAVTFTGGGHATSDATGLFQGDTTFAAGVDLDDVTGQAILTFDAVTDATGDITVTGAIDGATAGEGFIVISDDTSTTADTVTFASAIGANAAVNTITVGVTGADGGHAVFNSTVAATTINVGVADTDGDTATADFNGNVTATNLNILGGDTAGETGSVTASGNVTAAVDLDDATGGDGTAKITYDGTTAQTQTGAVSTDDGEGTVVVASGASVTFTSTIGSGAAGLDAMSVAGTATLKDDVFTKADAATDAGLTVDGTLNINSADAGVDILEDTGDIDFNGVVSITGDNATSITATSDLFIDGTFTTALESVALTLASTGDNVAVGGTADTTINIGNAITLNGDLAVSGNTGKTVTLAIKKTATFDPDTTTLITAAGDTVDIDSDGKMVVTLAADTVEIDSGATITVIDSDENVELDNVDTTYAALITSGDVELLDTAFVNFADNGSTAQDLLITATFNTGTSVVGAGFGDVADKLLTSITSATSTGTLETARGYVQGAATAARAQDLVEALAPTVDGSAQIGATSNVTTNTIGLTGERLAALRSNETGMAAGNMTHGLKVWGQGFATQGTQDQRDGVSGYDVDTYGVTVGMDTQTLAEDWVWGLAFTYANSDIDSDNLTNTQTDIDSYQIALYADYTWDAATYVSGQLGYGMNSGDQDRTNIGGVTGVNATADVDSDVFFLSLETGRDYDMNNGWTLTPIASLAYQYITSDDYSETCTATSTACLTNVDVDSMQILEAGLGAEASYLHQMADGSYIKPKLHAAYRYDFIGDEVQTTAAFAGASTTTFRADGFDAQQQTFDIGAGVSFYSTSNWELSANYDYQIKEDYDAHNGYIRASYKF